MSFSGEIHPFQCGGLNMVLDVSSGALHVVDEVAWEVITLLAKGLSREEVCRRLNGRFPPSALGETMREIQALVEEGVLFSPPLQVKEGKPASPVVKALCLHIAHACNLRCQYCFAEKGCFGGDELFMSPEVGRAAVDFLINSSGERKHCEIDFFGGEPLLNFPVVKDIVEYARKRASSSGKQIKFTLTTNGLLLNQETVQYMKDNDFSLILSLDGRPEVHNLMRPFPNGEGSYDAVVNRLQEFILNQGFEDYFVRGTYTRANLDFSRDVCHILDLGFRNISVEPVVASSAWRYALQENDLEIIETEYYNLARLYLECHLKGDPFKFFHFEIDLQEGPCLYKRLSGCGAGQHYLAVSPAGEIYPCHQFVGKKEFLGGNVQDWQNFDINIFSCIVNRADFKKECSKCWARYFCGGGCHANAYYMNGDITVPYKLGCNLLKKRLEYALYVQACISLQNQEGVSFFTGSEV